MDATFVTIRKISFALSKCERMNSSLQILTDLRQNSLSLSLSLQLTGIELMDTIDIRVNSSSPNDVDVVGRDFFDLVI